jgi:hypothetical protein
VSALDDLFSDVGNGQTAGGCEHCDAVQTMEQIEPDIYSLVVHHDDWCPFVRAKAAERN